jgi:hypothetical protein
MGNEHKLTNYVIGKNNEINNMLGVGISDVRMSEMKPEIL